MRHQIRRGFTLLEIVIVVMIIALMATLILPNVMGRFFSSQRKIAEAQVEKVKTQVSLYILDEQLGGLPDDFELSDLVSGGYLGEDDLLDPYHLGATRVPDEIELILVNSFYVDDFLHSSPSDEHALHAGAAPARNFWGGAAGGC